MDKCSECGQEKPQTPKKDNNHISRSQRWQKWCAYIYLFICIFDFVLVPTWFGLSRAVKPIPIDDMIRLDPQVQIRMIDAFTFQHDPFTLQGGGLFHLAFGALLTGSAVSSLRKQ